MGSTADLLALHLEGPDSPERGAFPLPNRSSGSLVLATLPDYYSLLVLPRSDLTPQIGQSLSVVDSRSSRSTKRTNYTVSTASKQRRRSYGVTPPHSTPLLRVQNSPSSLSCPVEILSDDEQTASRSSYCCNNTCEKARGSFQRRVSFRPKDNERWVKLFGACV